MSDPTVGPFDRDKLVEILTNLVPSEPWDEHERDHADSVLVPAIANLVFDWLHAQIDLPLNPWVLGRKWGEEMDAYECRAYLEKPSGLETPEFEAQYRVPRFSATQVDAWLREWNGETCLDGENAGDTLAQVWLEDVEKGTVVTE